MIEDPEIPGKPRPPKPHHHTDDQLIQVYEKVMRDSPGTIYADAAAIRLAMLKGKAHADIS